jgi:uroporphyrinogen decarboxylase
MTGKERAFAVINGKTPDRVPVFASTLAGAAWMQRVPQNLFHTKAETLADCVVTTARTLKLDGIFVSSDNWIAYEALGGEVVFPEDDEPWGKTALIQYWSDLDRLKLPDPSQAGRMPMMLDAVRKVVARAGGDLYVEANIDSGPFQLAMTLRGAQQAMLDLEDNVEMLRDLLEFGTQLTISYGKAMARTGVHGVQFGESSASLVGPRVFEEFILPYDQQVIEALKAEAVHAFLHVCGHSSHLINGLVRSGADCLEIDAMVDLSDVFSKVGLSICIRGNVDTMLLLHGPAERIEESAVACLAMSRAAGGRLILSPGCGVPKHTPPEHVLALVKAAELEAETFIPVRKSAPEDLECAAC